MPFEILVHHRYYTYGKVAGNTATYLKKSYAFAAAVFPVPIAQVNHVFDPVLYGRSFQFIFYYIAGKNISGSTVFPSRNNDRNIFFCRRYYPTVFGIYFIILFEIAA